MQGSAEAHGEDAAIVARRRYDAMLPPDVRLPEDLSRPRQALNAVVLVGLWTVASSLIANPSPALNAVVLVGLWTLDGLRRYASWVTDRFAAARAQARGKGA